MSLIQDAFDNSPVLTVSDMPDNTPLQQDRVLYSDHDERAGIEPMPMYIREGDVRYSTATRKPGETIQNYYIGGGGGGGDCSFVLDSSDGNIPVNGTLWFIHSVLETDDSFKLFLSEAVFVDGCLSTISNEAGHSITFNKLEFTVCGGDTVDASSFPSSTLP